MRNLTAILAGTLFGLGLYVSGMTDTDKVQGFLDIFGAWDPTLAFVMGGAILPMAGAWVVARKRRSALSGAALPGPSTGGIDTRLLAGAALFGTGWALVGLCPGPAIASATFGGWPGVAFLAAMVLGMIGLQWRDGRKEAMA